jgi:hypothetical protein
MLFMTVGAGYQNVCESGGLSCLDFEQAKETPFFHLFFVVYVLPQLLLIHALIILVIMLLGFAYLRYAKH